MYIVQNAWRNVFRNRGRNILLGCITLVVIAATVVALIISNTSAGIIEDYRARFGSEVSLQPDMNKLREQMEAQVAQEGTGGPMRMRIPQIPADQYLAFGDSEYLQQVVYSAQAMVNSDDLTAIDAEKGGGGGVTMGGVRSGEVFEQAQGTTYMFKLLCGAFDEFSDGTRELAEGTMPENANECIISSDLAEANGISVGDSVTLTSELTSGDPPLPGQESTQEVTDITYTLKVVGIYDDATDEYGEYMIENAFSNRRNEILTSFATIVSAYIEGWDGISINATYYLKDPEMLEAFANELYAKGLDPMFNVATDFASYNSIVRPVENLKNIAFVFVIVVLVIGAAIIALLASLAVRERKYEIGVLRAMGMKKATVGLGLWLELIIVTVICLVIGLGVGTLAAKPISDFMLESQLAATESAAMPGASMITSSGPASATGGIAGGPTLSAGPVSIMGGSLRSGGIEPLTSLNASLGWDTFLEIILVALVLSTIAGLISTLQITKYEPIKILMERN